jgi:hypothetical protein
MFRWLCSCGVVDQGTSETTSSPRDEQLKFLDGPNLWTSSDEKPGASEGEVGQHEEVPSQRRSGSKNNGDVLHDSGSLCTTLRKRILGTDRRFDQTTSKYS